MIKKQFAKRLELSNQLYMDLIFHIPENFLSNKLADLPSNTIGQQIWCVIGARNSYLNAAKAGMWTGFSSPLDIKKSHDRQAISNALVSTSDEVKNYFSELNDIPDPA